MTYMIRLLTVVSCVCAGAGSPAWGENDSDRRARPRDPFDLSFGIYLVDFDTETRVGSSGPAGGTRISLEDDLGMGSDDTELLAAGRWRFARRHSIGLGYLDFDRNGDVTLARDIIFGDTTFTLGLNAESFLDYEVWGMDYRYAFIARDNLDVEAMLGVS